MLKTKLEDLIKESITKAIEQDELGELAATPDEIAIDHPKTLDHGDRAVSVAMKLAKQAKLAPRIVAESIVKHIDQQSFSNIEIAGPGFINLSINWDVFEDCIAEIHKQDTAYGRVPVEQRPDQSFSKILVEYVSANPTGDLHIGHGRQAVLGSALASLLQWAGYEVSSEFYINDAGVQMGKLAKSAQMAIAIQEGKAKQEEYDEEELYPLESMLEFITPDKYANLKSRDLDACGDFAKQVFLDEQAKVLETIGVSFDSWYSEKDHLHQEQDHKVKALCDLLATAGLTYEEEGALWFKAKELGDERNRVLKKSDGNYTYLAADLAYHLDKFARHHDKLINVWGADHHGQEPSLRAGMQAVLDALKSKGSSFALKSDSVQELLEIVFIQMVSLSKDGEAVKMSKRAGTIVNVRDLIEEVGVDALRYFLVESQANNHMVFDLELAKKQDKDNPVYYIQYAHARTCSIIRTLLNEKLDQEEIGDTKIEDAILSQEEWLTWQSDFKNNQALFKQVFAVLDAEALKSTKALMLQLLRFPEDIREAALTRSPHKIANYLKELATLFHQFYAHNRVIVEDQDLMKARASLVLATQKVLRNALNLLEISAPSYM